MASVLHLLPFVMLVASTLAIEMSSEKLGHQTEDDTHLGDRSEPMRQQFGRPTTARA